MPASMMMAPAGFMLKVSGNSIAIVAGGPRPGRIQTTVPRNTPTKHHNKLAGTKATSNPCHGPWRISTLEAQDTGRKRYAERLIEDQIESSPACGGDGRRGQARLAVHHRDDEVCEQRQADDEPQRVERRNRYGEREPGREGSRDATPIDRASASRHPFGVRDHEQRGEREYGDAVPERDE